MTIPITGDILTDVLTFFAIAWAVRYCYSLLVSG